MGISAKVRTFVIITLLLFIFLGMGLFVTFYTDWLWFNEVGYPTIFTTILFTKISILLFLGIIFFLIVWGNIKLAQYLSPKNIEWYDEKSIFIQDIKIPRDKINRILFFIIIFLSFMVGTGGINRWQDILYFLNPHSFNIQDPIFGRDVAFYMFTLPIYEFIANWLFTTILFALLGTIVIYMFNQAISFLSGKISINPNILSHLSILLAILSLIMGFQYWLNMFGLLYSTRGVAFGAFYTDVHAQLLAYRVLMGISIIVAIILFINIRLRKITTPVIALVVWIVVSIGLGHIYPGIVQRLLVVPNELAKERPFIEHNIRFTNEAFGLNKIRAYNFPVEGKLNMEVIERNQPTISNVRLWDPRPLIETYKQIQVIRQYYNFHNVDIDRYQIGDEYVQVMLSAREIAIPAAARTWTNERLIYTHGYGIAATRVNAVEQEGLPELLIRDIPPVSPVGLDIKRPEIYFGESQQDYILVKTSELEFNFPHGDENVFTSYAGKAGIPIYNLFRRLLFAYLFGSKDLLFTHVMTPDTRILYRRHIMERAKTIMPFLSFDPDPYIVIADGKLYWILDAYTKSMRYPYSQPYNNQFNYIRNPVKTIISAYDGTVDFYVIDPDDPMIQTWMKLFPDYFKPFEQMPESLQRHIRYPEKLFRVQAETYATYHMREAQIFYNKEDLWTLPQEIFEATQVQMEPYYIIMQLPQHDEEEFIIMTPFTPANRNNMIAWMAAKCDPPNYGELIVYNFPKEKLIYGPLQIESRIDQDPEISRQLALWNQLGTRVIRGSLLVLPIEDSILYIEPIFLRSAQSQIPELKRIIVAYEEQIYMGETLEEALQMVFSPRSARVAAAREQIPADMPVGTPQIRSLQELASDANRYYERAQNRLQTGDWTGYGEEMRRLRETLQQMQQN